MFVLFYKPGVNVKKIMGGKEAGGWGRHSWSMKKAGMDDKTLAHSFLHHRLHKKSLLRLKNENFVRFLT